MSCRSLSLRASRFALSLPKRELRYIWRSQQRAAAPDLYTRPLVVQGIATPMGSVVVARGTYTGFLHFTLVQQQSLRIANDPMADGEHFDIHFGFAAPR